MGIWKILTGTILILLLHSCHLLNKSYPVQIFNACSDFCDSINVKGVAGKFQNTLREKASMKLNILQPKNHEIYKSEIRSILIYPPKAKKEAQSIKQLIPFVKDSITTADTIQLLLGIDVFSLKWIKNKIPNSKLSEKTTIIANSTLLKHKDFKDMTGKNKFIVLKNDHLDLSTTGKIIYNPGKKNDALEVKNKIEKIVKINIKLEPDSTINGIIAILNPSHSDIVYKPVSKDYWIKIIKHEFKLYLYKGEKLIKTYPVALGKNTGDKQRVGDMRTPEGDFYIIKIHDSRNWTHDFKDGKGPIKGAYGPWFLRLYTGADRTKSGKAWTGIGIHGTHDSTSIGKMVSEGCIRMYNHDIEELKNLVKIGTRVIIEP